GPVHPSPSRRRSRWVRPDRQALDEGCDGGSLRHRIADRYRSGWQQFARSRLPSEAGTVHLAASFPLDPPFDRSWECWKKADLSPSHAARNTALACRGYRPPAPFGPCRRRAINPWALLRPLGAADWRGSLNVRLPIPIAAFRAQGGLSQLSAIG